MVPQFISWYEIDRGTVFVYSPHSPFRPLSLPTLVFRVSNGADPTGTAFTNARADRPHRVLQSSASRFQTGIPIKKISVKIKKKSFGKTLRLPAGFLRDKRMQTKSFFHRSGSTLRLSGGRERRKRANGAHQRPPDIKIVNACFAKRKKMSHSILAPLNQCIKKYIRALLAGKSNGRFGVCRARRFFKFVIDPPQIRPELLYERRLIGWRKVLPTGRRVLCDKAHNIGGRGRCELLRLLGCYPKLAHLLGIPLANVLVPKNEIRIRRATPLFQESANLRPPRPSRQRPLHH